MSGKPWGTQEAETLVLLSLVNGCSQKRKCKYLLNIGKGTHFYSI